MGPEPRKISQAHNGRLRFYPNDCNCEYYDEETPPALSYIVCYNESDSVSAAPGSDILFRGRASN